MASTRKPQKKRKTTQQEKRNPVREKAPRDWMFGAVIDSLTGNVSLIEPEANFFRQIGRHLVIPKVEDFERGEASVIQDGRRTTTALEWFLGRGGGGSKRYSRYQFLTGTVLPSLRERLLPGDDDFESILEQVNFYRGRTPWLKRGLRLWAAISARQFRVDAPGGKADKKGLQTEWLLDMRRELRLYSFMREFLSMLKTYDQAVVMWRTAVGGRDPISIECPDLAVYQPRFDPRNGARPNVVVVVSNDEDLRRLLEDERSSDANTASQAKRKLAAYPAPILAMARGANSGERLEIPGESLAKYGVHFDYTAVDRRHWEDWALPGMYSIFPYLEMLMMADDADINALHHYKAGILLVRLGPSEPRDANLLATEDELKAIDKKLVAMAKARLPAWAARGDLHVDWIVPPENIISDAKVKSAKEKVLDWIGMSRLAWPGQGFEGAYAAGLVGLKFQEAEVLDLRDIAKELMEGWFYARSKETNKFKGAVWPRVWFDPTSLKEQRLILDEAKAYMQWGGAGWPTIAGMLGHDYEVWLAERRQTERLKGEYDEDFLPDQVGLTNFANPPGRTPTKDQPTPEGQERRQPRPSTTEAVDKTLAVVERDFGIDIRELRDAVEREGIVTESTTPD